MGSLVLGQIVGWAIEASLGIYRAAINLMWLNYFNGFAAFILISSIKGTLPLAVTLIATPLS